MEVVHNFWHSVSSPMIMFQQLARVIYQLKACTPAQRHKLTVKNSISSTNFNSYYAPSIGELNTAAIRLCSMLLAQSGALN